MTGLCYCDDCQEAGRRLEELSGAPAVMEQDGGTALVLWRKDRVEVIRGREFLEKHRLRDDSPTDRRVATCCNTALFLNFSKAHWYSLYRQRFAEPPALEVAIQLRFAEGVDEATLGVPAYQKYPLWFIGKMMKVRLAMLFGR